MKLTDVELAELRRYRNEPDEDNVRYKQIIKDKKGAKTFIQVFAPFLFQFDLEFQTKCPVNMIFNIRSTK